MECDVIETVLGLHIPNAGFRFERVGWSNWI